MGDDLQNGSHSVSPPFSCRKCLAVSGYRVTVNVDSFGTYNNYVPVLTLDLYMS